MTDMILAGQFVAAKIGVNSLTVTVDIEAIEIATGTRTAHTTGASATAVGRRGLYTYRLTGATPATHVYIGTFITADTSVDQREVSAVAMVVPDALVSAVETDTQNIQSRLPAALVDNRMDANVSRLNGAATDGSVAAGNRPTLSLKSLDLNNPDASGVALSAVASGESSKGIFASGSVGQHNTGDIGQHNEGSTAGQFNAGVDAGQQNNGSTGVGAHFSGASGVDISLENDGTIQQAVWEYVERTLTEGGGATVEQIIEGILAILAADVTGVGTFFKLIKDKLNLITTATEITVDSPVNGGMLTVTKAVSLESGLLDVTVPGNWTKCLVTFKKDKDDPDTAALFQIVESNPGAGTDGLLYLNGAAATAGQGSVTVDEGNNQVSFTLTDNATAQLPRRGGHWDIKFLKSDGESTRPVAGLGQVVLPVTLTI